MGTKCRVYMKKKEISIILSQGAEQLVHGLFVLMVVTVCSTLAWRVLEVGGLVNRQGVKNAGFDRGYLSVCPLTFPGCFYILFSTYFSPSNPGFTAAFLLLRAKLNEPRGSE